MSKKEREDMKSQQRRKEAKLRLQISSPSKLHLQKKFLAMDFVERPSALSIGTFHRDICSGTFRTSFKQTLSVPDIQILVCNTFIE